jgi:maleate isomerase
VARPFRVGLVVPSSNTTMETELPELLRRRGEIAPEAFTFHSSRVRMRNVTREELAAMVAGSDRCAAELADARVDVVAYACLVAVMAEGAGAHERVERRLEETAAEAGAEVPVVSSAGALVAGLRALGAERVAVVAPYVDELMALVTGYLRGSGFDVTDSVNLCIANNLEVGAHDPARLPALARSLDLAGADALVLSACVQMPSLPALQLVEDELGLPVLSAATATARAVLERLGVAPVVPGAGALLGAGTATVAA